MSAQVASGSGPHQGQPVYAAGEPLDRARAAAILLHGRGATAQSILGLAGDLARPGVAFLAPQAAGNSWYPERFLAPVERNEPELSSALQAVGEVLRHVTEQGIPPERIVLLGFSQGACLALEFAARNPRRYGGVVGLSGGLIGVDVTPRPDNGSLAGTPVFLGCSEHDFHIPQERVHESAQVLERLGGEVTVRLYPNLGHAVNQDELDLVRDLLAQISA